MERDQLHKEDSQWKKARCQGDSFQGENRELGNFRGFMDLFCVCFLSLLYLLNYNKFGGLQQHGFILFCFWGSDVPFHWAPVEMLARLVLSGGAEGGTCFFACGHFVCFQRASFQVLRLSSHCHLLR